jgi:hypothetical protein
MSQGEGLRELVTPELKKDDAMRVLWSRARRRAQEDWDTKDLLAEALSRVIDPDDMPGDPSKDFVGHVTFAIRTFVVPANAPQERRGRGPRRGRRAASGEPAREAVVEEAILMATSAAVEKVPRATA